MKVCRICMSKDDKLFPISSNGLYLLYAQLTGAHNLPEDVDKSLPQWVCEECGLRLMSYDKLRQKGLRAHRVLSQLLERVTYITEDELNQIDRRNNESEGHVDVPLPIDSYQDIDNSIKQEKDTLEQKKTHWKSAKKKNDSQFNVSNAVRDNGRREEEDDSEQDNTLLRNCLDVPEPIKWSSQQNNIGVEVILSNTLMESDIIQEDSSELDKTILENCLDTPGPSKCNSEQYNNDLDSIVSNTVMDDDIIEEESAVSLDPDSTMMEDRLDDSKPSESLLENTIDIQELDATNHSRNLDKIKEFVINLETGESPLVFKTNGNTDLLPLNSKNKKQNLNMNQIIDSLQNKIPQIKVKKLVGNQKVAKQKVVKQKVAKQKVVKQKVTNQDENKVVQKYIDSLSTDEFKITIRTLSMKEQIAEFEQRKYSRNYTSSPYKCNVCYIGYDSDISLARHNLVHSEKWRKYECKICKRRFAAKANYKSHMDSHENVFGCTACPFTARHRKTAEIHSLHHKGTVYKCSDCNQEFKSKGSLTYHRRLNHVSKFVCKYCGFSYENAYGLKQHISLRHWFEKSKQASGDDPTCTTCNITFVSDKALNTHLLVAHPKKTSLKKVPNIETNWGKPKTSIVCDLCGVKTANGKSYAVHFKRFHSSQSKPAEQFICENCGKVFKSRFLQKRHALVHLADAHRRPYECDECGKKFDCKASIKTHILNKHLPKKSKPSSSYPCEFCGKIYKSLPGRKNHVAKSHLGKKGVYSCTICGNIYNYAASVKRHMMIVHSGQRPFVCDTCGKSFTAKHKMREHIEHLHMSVPRPARGGARRKGSVKPMENL